LKLAGGLAQTQLVINIEKLDLVFYVLHVTLNIGDGTMNNIDKIRQLLTQAEKEAQKGLMEYDNAILGTLSQIKALLPCERCGGTGKIIGPPIITDPKEYDWEPCSDCQRKDSK
jgi:hypothetical protein